jgi:GNAT superfamily N-acetyltransferase
MGGPREWAWIAFAHAGSTAIIAEAIQIGAPKAQCCEIALSVTDVWQRRGVGTLLLTTMECRARTLGARYLVGDVLRTNDAMKGLARKAGFAIRGPFRDARLIEIVKDLSSPQTGAVQERGRQERDFQPALVRGKAVQRHLHRGSGGSGLH